MGEIKRYTLEVNTGWDDEVVTKTFVLASDHEKALTEAKKEGVRKWLEKWYNLPPYDFALVFHLVCAKRFDMAIEKVEGV